MMKSQNEIETNWENHWKEILTNPDGSINVDQLKLELMDFSDLINRMTHLTCEITGHRLSYPTYQVNTILGVMNEYNNSILDDQKTDDLKNCYCSFCHQEIE